MKKFALLRLWNALIDHALCFARATAFNGVTLFMLFCLCFIGSLVAQSLPGFPNNKILNAVPTVSALEALPVTIMTSGTAARVLGYSTAGDAPPVEFILSTSPCSLNSGAGDGGAQHPSNTSGYCWIMAPQTVYDARWWGVLYGGTDPNNNNGTQLTAAATYVGSLPVTLGGSVRQDALNVSGPVLVDQTFNINVSNLYLPQISLVAGSGLAPSGGVCPAVISITHAGVHNFGSLLVDVNEVPGVNGFDVEANGTNHFNFLYIRHWIGSCGSVTVTATGGVTGSHDLQVSSSTGVTTGMYAHDTGTALSRLSYVVDVPDSTDIYLSKGLTGTASGNLNLYRDANGIQCGLTGSCGGTYGDLNIQEWLSSDSQNGNIADYYGAAFYCSGAGTGNACNQISILHGLLTGGATPVFLDQGSGTFNLNAGVQVDSALNVSNITNPPSIALAAGSGNLQTDSVLLGGGVILGFVTRSSGAESNMPAINLGTVKFTPYGSPTYNPAAIVQLYTNQTGTNFSGVSIGGPDGSLPSGFSNWWSVIGPGTAADGGNPNFSAIQGTLGNFTRQAETLTTGETFGFSDCSQTIYLNTGSTATTFTLPSSLSGIQNAADCDYYIVPQGSADTLAVSGSSTINGLTYSETLAQNQPYLVTTEGEPGSVLNWGISPSPNSPNLNGGIYADSSTGNSTLSGLNLQLGVINRTGCTANVTDTTGTATALMNYLMPSATVGANFTFKVLNNCTYTETIAGGTGVTTSGTMTIAAGTNRLFEAVLTATGTPAITLNNIGGGTIN